MLAMAMCSEGDGSIGHHMSKFFVSSVVRLSNMNEKIIFSCKKQQEQKDLGVYWISCVFFPLYKNLSE